MVIDSGKAKDRTWEVMPLSSPAGTRPASSYRTVGGRDGVGLVWRRSRSRIGAIC